MQQAMENGLKEEGLLPGGLKLQRKAASCYAKSVGLKDYARVMKQTGKDLPSLYKETSLGGLAVFGDKQPHTIPDHLFCYCFSRIVRLPCLPVLIFKTGKI